MNNNGNSNGTIAIETSKTFRHNTRYRKVEKISGVLTKRNLPPHYLERGPWMLFDAEKREIVGKSEKDEDKRIVMAEGIVYDEKVFRQRMEFVELCGSRLHAINAERRRQQHLWRGQEVFQI